jgi:outer membrane lipoprotein-sorting protein
MKNRLLALCALNTALLFACAPMRAEEATPTAESLLKKMEATYAAGKSYHDSISVHFRNPDGAEGAEAECKVWFQRPDFFLIDGQLRRAPGVPPTREVIWSNKSGARAWSTTNPVTSSPKVQIAGSKMFGTYAYHIPTLLEASYGGPRRLHQLDSPTLAGEETFGGVECYRISGTWQGDAYEVWLGKADSLVRKIHANYKGYEMEEIHRDISLNPDIPAKTFDFAPEGDIVPKKKKSRK